MPKIWVADDDQAIRMVLEESLSSDGFDVTLFESGEELITELKKGEIIEDLEANKIIFVNGVLSNVDFKYENLEKIEIEKNADLNEEVNQNALLNLNSASVSYTHLTLPTNSLV